jgi:hypothetical protein
VIRLLFWLNIHQISFVHELFVQFGTKTKKT